MENNIAIPFRVKDYILGCALHTCPVRSVLKGSTFIRGRFFPSIRQFKLWPCQKRQLYGLVVFMTLDTVVYECYANEAYGMLHVLLVLMHTSTPRRPAARLWISAGWLTVDVTMSTLTALSRNTASCPLRPRSFLGLLLPLQLRQLLFSN